MRDSLGYVLSVSHYLCKEVDLFPIFIYAISQRKKGNTGDFWLLSIAKVCMYGCVYVFMIFFFFFTSTYVSRVFGSNPEVIISIVTLRTDVLSFLDSPVYTYLKKKDSGKAEHLGLGLDALKLFLLRCITIKAGILGLQSTTHSDQLKTTPSVWSFGTTQVHEKCSHLQTPIACYCLCS